MKTTKIIIIIINIFLPLIAMSQGTYNGHEYVDLGLSVKWATCNIGASSPFDYGDYYAWGEIGIKYEYTPQNSKTYNKKIKDIAGDDSYDVARVQWGGLWRIPTKAEFEELIDNCTWINSTQDGHQGHLVISNINGNSIFLPNAGSRQATSHDWVGQLSWYWSSTPDKYSSYSWICHYTRNGAEMNSAHRYFGCSIRPVLGQ